MSVTRPSHAVRQRLLGRRGRSRLPARAGAPAPLPLILTHGWPSSFVEMLPLADRLTVSFFTPLRRF
ncbi:epoxide hydrolase N-terminal domain-containing protein [Nonomuraea sp. NPDC049141]|uniref:epoxide hydrolase N-terminal domain-containing protein n=1 Tax=Nonomuraea sp. NPDC049141 TaxID=3155500 RepID=UPI0033D33E94